MTFHKHFFHCAFLVIVFLVCQIQAAATPAWPFYQKLLPTVSVSPLICGSAPKCFSFLLLIIALFPRGEMPALKTPHSTTGLVTCSHGCPFGDTCRIPPVMQVAEASNSSLPSIKSQRRFLYMHHLESQNGGFLNQDVHRSQGTCTQEKTVCLHYHLEPASPQSRCVQPLPSARAVSILRAPLRVLPPRTGHVAQAARAFVPHVTRSCVA